MGKTGVWENTTGKEVARMTHEGLVTAVGFSPDGRLVVSGSGDHTVRVWESTTGKEVARMTHESPVRAVSFSPDGRLVVSGSGGQDCAGVGEYHRQGSRPHDA